MKYRNKREAAEAWVREFDAIDSDMVAELMEYNPMDWHEVTIVPEDERDEWEDYHDSYLPMWGTMWQFHDSADIGWVDFRYNDDEETGLEALSRCGFRVYESEKYGYFFGIDGGGHDFYEAHWIPLYEARGLQWHESEEV